MSVNVSDNVSVNVSDNVSVNVSDNLEFKISNERSGSALLPNNVYPRQEPVWIQHNKHVV